MTDTLWNLATDRGTNVNDETRALYYYMTVPSDCEDVADLYADN